ncbi:helix-turn-helix domain-containing protein [Salinirussus salinus]|uniref:helix-turn-helix domain-containing protein n=1 Tax=Salinirussus salinus TaxID=1198300 RepID=UPI00135877AE|nr:helix-turn-helix domain-containing protein [Salinirussus salinus]
MNCWNIRWTEISEDVEYGFENIDEVASLMKAFDKPEKIKAYDLLSQGYLREEIVDELDVSESTFYNYRDAFKQNGWIDRRGNLTEEGEFVYDQLQSLDEEYGQFLYQQAVDQLGIDEEDLDSIEDVELPE